ncbi:phage tail protein [Paenibacillus marchantiae]|uniref:phage tail protein n=1 Tax=Paenibacillus marchantiae TaxID=3026433 RepID=UPI00237B127C|nr:phage tail protein [Paenibacillus marchantiae]WDQ34799.1 phage tail protein [Paenibacillus marchantiae]
MPQETDRLKLPLPLGNENVTRESINGIFEKIDAGVATKADLDTLREAVSKMDIPDASLTQKGKVQLSSKTDGTSETVAATEKAVSDARVAAETNAKNVSLPRTGGSLIGDAGVLHLVGSTHVYQGFLPAGTNEGRKGYLGFGTPGGKDFTIANEYGGELIFRDKSGATSLSDLKSSVSDGKASIAAAITGKGVETSGSETFSTLSNNISKIRTGVIFNNLSYGKTQTGTVQGTNGFFVTDNIITIPSGVERVSFISRQKNTSKISVSYSSDSDTLLQGIIAIRNIDAPANPYTSGNSFLYSVSGSSSYPLRLLDIDFVNREITIQTEDDSQYTSTSRMDNSLNNKSPLIIYAAFYFRNAAGGSYYVNRSISVSLIGRLYFG